jgi:hypothetical protein
MAERHVSLSPLSARLILTITFEEDYFWQLSSTEGHICKKKKIRRQHDRATCRRRNCTIHQGTNEHKSSSGGKKESAHWPDSSRAAWSVDQTRWTIVRWDLISSPMFQRNLTTYAWRSNAWLTQDLASFPC